MSYNKNMSQKMQSDFETAADILKSLDFNYNNDFEEQKQMLFSKWNEFAGEKLAKYSKPTDLTDDGVMIVKCKNSVVANELFVKKTDINALIKNEAKKIGQMPFKYIRITYGK